MASMEQRMKALEEEVAQLKTKLAKTASPRRPWWKEIAGIFAGDPDFLEAMRLGREYRESLRHKPRKRRKELVRKTR